MTDYDSHVIIRVGKGSDDPLDPKKFNTKQTTQNNLKIC